MSTELIISLASGLIEGGDILNLDKICKYYAIWILTNPKEISSSLKGPFSCFNKF